MNRERTPWSGVLPAADHRNYWRETEWLLELIRAALWPEFKIAHCLARWNDIAKDLAERNRRRMSRIVNLLS